MLTEVPDNYIYLFIFNIPKSINPWNISDQQEYIFKQIMKYVSKSLGQGLFMNKVITWQLWHEGEDRNIHPFLKICINLWITLNWNMEVYRVSNERGGGGF